MPYPTTGAAKGYTFAGAEYGTSLQGLNALLTDTAVSALPVSATNAISATATYGMRLVIFAYNHTASGTISIAGTAPFSGAAVNETSTTLPVMERPGQMAQYATTNTYATINASGITLGGGLTNGRIQIYGIQAAHRLLPGIFKLSDKTKEHSPQAQRGIYDRDVDLVPLAKECEWEWECDGYPDSSLWLLYSSYSAAPTIASIPASPTALLAATSSVSSGNASLTAQPTTPGMILQVVIAGGPASAGTVTITGTNLLGEAYSETVVPSNKFNNTFYSIGVFASVNASGVVWTAMGGGATVAVNGIFGWSFTGLPGDTLQTNVFEQWDGQSNWVAPFAFCDEWTIEGGMDAEVKITGKGKPQDVIPVGDTTNSAVQITALTQSQDRPITGWRGLIWIDSISGTAGTTVQADLRSWKITVATPWSWRYTSAGNPQPYMTPTRAYRGKRHVEVELKLDLTTTVLNSEIQAFRRRNKRQVRIQLLGDLLGTVAGTNYNQGWIFDLPLRYVADYERAFDASTENVEVTLKGMVEYDVALGYSHKIQYFGRYPSW